LLRARNGKEVIFVMGKHLLRIVSYLDVTNGCWRVAKTEDFNLISGQVFP